MPSRRTSTERCGAALPPGRPPPRRRPQAAPPSPMQGVSDDVAEMAEYMGIELAAEKNLLWVAEQVRSHSPSKLPLKPCADDAH